MGPQRILAKASAYLRQPAAWIAIVVMASQSAVIQIAMQRFVEREDFEGLATFTTFAPLSDVVVSGILIQLLGRKLIGNPAGKAGGMLARWLGLLLVFEGLTYLWQVILVVLMHSLGISSIPEWANAVSILLLCLLLFPLLVRLMATAGGIDSPRLGAVIVALARRPDRYWAAYAIAWAAPNTAMLILQFQIGDWQNALWVACQCLAAGVIGALGYLVAVNTAQELGRLDDSIAKTFA